MKFKIIPVRNNFGKIIYWRIITPKIYEKDFIATSQFDAFDWVNDRLDLAYYW